MNEIGDEDYTFYSFDGDVYREHGVWKPGKPCEIILEMWSKAKQEWVTKYITGRAVEPPLFSPGGDNPRYITREQAYQKRDMVVWYKDPEFLIIQNQALMKYLKEKIEEESKAKHWGMVVNYEKDLKARQDYEERLKKQL